MSTQTGRAVVQTTVEACNKHGHLLVRARVCILISVGVLWLEEHTNRPGSGADHCRGMQQPWSPTGSCQCVHLDLGRGFMAWDARQRAGEWCRPLWRHAAAMVTYRFVPVCAS